MSKQLLAIILLCWFFIPASAQSEKGTSEPVIFSVNKKPVSAAEFIYLYKKNHQNKTDDFSADKVEEYLDLFINFKLKVAEAQQRGLDTTEAFRKEFNSYKDELRRPYLPDAKLLDSLVKLTYARMQEEVNASHILIKLPATPTPEDTLAAYNKVMGLRARTMGGEDFATLAQAYSEDPSAKTNKGNLGYFTAMQMVYPFEVAAFTTKKGDVSMPVRTQFGYHIIQVSDRRPSRGEVEVSHIMIRTGDEHDNEKAKNTIFDIYDQLQKGVNWNELCKQFSEDPASRDAGGRLRPFGVGVMGAVPEFEQIAFNLDKPGDISDPFQTQFGWHILKLERKIPLLSYDELAPSLKTRVGRDERVQISRQALQSKMKKEFNYNENSAVKNKVMAMADSSLQKGNWTPPTSEVNASETLFTLNSKAYSVKDFFQYVAKNQRANSIAPGKYFETLLNNFVEFNLLSALEEKIIVQSPDYKWLLREYYEGILLFEIMEKEVWNKATEDSVGQLNYFNANASKYLAGERIQAKIYSSSSPDAIAQLNKRITQGDTTKLKEFITINGIKHDEGAYQKESRAVLSKIKWEPGTYQVESNGTHYLVVADKILPPGRQTFQEARPEVISDYQTYLEKTWVAKLKKKYPVKINKKEKQYAFQQLVKK
jgi:peptidyl-prolyl cis-trans isomerase SurA